MAGPGRHVGVRSTPRLRAQLLGIAMFAHDGACATDGGRRYFSLPPAAHPELVDRLVLFGAVAQRNGQADPVTRTWDTVTTEDQYQKFIREVPEGQVPKLFETEFANWGKAYLASDPRSMQRQPAAVAVPLGPVADAAASWSGRFPYSMAGITARVLIVRGEWDGVGSAADAEWLEGQLVNAEHVDSVELAKGTHLMHLETGCTKLFAVVNTFLTKS